MLRFWFLLFIFYKLRVECLTLYFLGGNWEEYKKTEQGEGSSGMSVDKAEGTIN